jgi:nitrate reductase gamma subunit
MNDYDHTSHSILRLILWLIAISLVVTAGVGLVFWTIGLVFGIAGLIVKVALITAVAALVWRRITRRRYHESSY